MHLEISCAMTGKNLPRYLPRYLPRLTALLWYEISFSHIKLREIGQYTYILKGCLYGGVSALLVGLALFAEIPRLS